MINWLLQPLQLLAIVGALIGAFELNNWSQRSRGAASVIEKTNKAAENLSEKAVENRERGDVPDALAKLRKRSCSNC